MKRLSQYLHARRLHSALSEQELATLLGVKSASNVSRIETEVRRPTIEAALACQVLFGIPPAELFPQLYIDVEEAVMRRVHKLHERLQGDPSSSTKAKLNFLEAAQKRTLERAEKSEA